MRLLLGFFCLISQVWAAPNIAVSIPPIHSIVSNITQGVSTPSLLLEAQQSAHHFHLKPKQLSLIERSDLLVIVHPTFESGLAKIFQHTDPNNRLSVAPIDDEMHEAHGQEVHEAHGQDPHLWLDIAQMQAFAHKLVDKLTEIDPTHQSQYLANLAKLEQQLDNLHRHIKQQLSQAGNKSVATYSNAFDVLIDHYQLTHTASVVEQHEQRPSIKNLLVAKQSMRQHQTECLLATTEVSPKQIHLLKENLSLNIARIDILGANLNPGSDLYVQLMQHITKQVRQCLQ